MIKKKPQTISGGMRAGFGTAIDSTISGLTGIVQKPAEGYRQDGAAGFAFGALKGVAGLLVKPVAGALDIVSKTSQGIEAASSNQKQGQDERIRPPRVFYGKDKVIRNIDMIHSNLLLLIPKLHYRLPEVPLETL